MSVPLLVLGLADLAVVVALGVWVRGRYRLALTTVAEKREGLLFFYRAELAALLSSGPSREVLLSWIHYLSLHLLVPLLGLGFYLRSDANFLVVILGGFLSLKLVQRVFPGTRLAEPSQV